MANEYDWEDNPLRDVLMELITNGVDISDKYFKTQLNSMLIQALESNVRDRNDLYYLDFDVIKSGEHYKIIGNNIVTALWLIGYYIGDDPKEMIDNNVCVVENGKYSFNNTTKVLKFKQDKIKNNE